MADSSTAQISTKARHETVLLFLRRAPLAIIASAHERRASTCVRLRVARDCSRGDDGTKIDGVRAGKHVCSCVHAFETAATYHIAYTIRKGIGDYVSYPSNHTIKLHRFQCRCTPSLARAACLRMRRCDALTHALLRAPRSECRSLVLPPPPVQPMRARVGTRPPRRTRRSRPQRSRAHRTMLPRQ